MGISKLTKKTKSTLKTCENGHHFYKSSEGPTCPICEEGQTPQAHFLSSLAAPARRALENNGILTLEPLSKYSATEVLQFHGMGKTTIPKLEKLLVERKLAFKSKV